MVKSIRDKKGKLIGVEDESIGQSRQPTPGEIISNRGIASNPFGAATAPVPEAQPRSEARPTGAQGPGSGDAFIQAREKEISRLAGGGEITNETKRQASLNVIESGVGLEQVSVEEKQALRGQFEELTDLTRIDELTEQILNPDLALRSTGEGVPSLAPFGRGESGETVDVGDGRKLFVSDQELAINDGQKQTKGLVTTNINEDTSVVSAEAQILFQQIVTQGAKGLGGSLIDKRLQNMEQALVNHKEGSADIIKALQVGAYDPVDAIQDTNNMVDDVALVEETMKLLSIHAPSVYAEQKGWEFTTRITKIRRSLISSQQQVLNVVEFGQPLPPESQEGALATGLLDLQNK